jgi:regulatory protein RepA
MRDFIFDGGCFSGLASCRIDFRQAAQTKPEPIDFVTPGLAAGSFGLCFSQGGVGKSMFSLQKAASICLGEDPFGFWSDEAQSCQLKAGPVVMVSAEDPTRVLENRIYSVGSHLTEDQQVQIGENLLLLSTQGQGFNVGGGQDSPWLDALKRLVDKWGKTPRLMIFDTLNRCLGGANENSSTDMGAVVSAFESFCVEYGCATMVLHHANRSAVRKDEVHSLLASRGSSALTDNARYVETMTARSDGTVAVAFPKTSYSEQPDPLCLRRDDHGVLWGVHPTFSSTSPKEKPLAIEYQPEVADDEDGWT